jgi:maltooligosyltrehalose trehalohydrolase
MSICRATKQVVFNQDIEAPQSHGARYNQIDKSAIFSIWAPDADRVSVLFKEGSQWDLISIQEGWFTLELARVPCTYYRFIINGEMYVPDPAAQAQFGDVHGWSQLIDHSLFPWKYSQWQGRPWHEAIIYEMHVGLVGGFRGAESLIPHLANTGVTAIELMPLGEFPGSRNWGYDGVLIFAPESSYGTPDDLKSFVDTAHRYGLMVLVDVVYNHFGPEGNYLHCYASSFFRNDRKTPWGSAINFELEPVKQFFVDNARMWLMDYRVDGLRFDAVHVMQDNKFLIEMSKRIRDEIDPHRHIHLIVENENNSTQLLEKGFTAQWNDDAHNVLHHLITGESDGYYRHFAEDATKKLATSLSEGFIFQGQDSNGRSRGEPSKHLSPLCFINFLQNHDQIGNRAFGERLRVLTDHRTLKVATTLLLLSPFVPLIFMGDELGSRSPFLYFTDHPRELADLVCKGRREEFADFVGQLNRRLPEEIPNPNHISTFFDSRIDFDYFSPEQNEWRFFYKELLHIRKQQITPCLTQCEFGEASILGPSAIDVFWRLSDRKILNIHFNLGPSPVFLIHPILSTNVIYKFGVTRSDLAMNILPGISIVASLHQERD